MQKPRVTCAGHFTHARSLSSITSAVTQGNANRESVPAFTPAISSVFTADGSVQYPFGRNGHMYSSTYRKPSPEDSSPAAARSSSAAREMAERVLAVTVRPPQEYS